MEQSTASALVLTEIDTSFPDARVKRGNDICIRLIGGAALSSLRHEETGKALVRSFTVCSTDRTFRNVPFPPGNTAVFYRGLSGERDIQGIRTKPLALILYRAQSYPDLPKFSIQVANYRPCVAVDKQRDIAVPFLEMPDC